MAAAAEAPALVPATIDPEYSLVRWRGRVWALAHYDASTDEWVVVTPAMDPPPGSEAHLARAVRLHDRGEIIEGLTLDVASLDVPADDLVDAVLVPPLGAEYPERFSMEEAVPHPEDLRRIARVAEEATRGEPTGAGAELRGFETAASGLPDGADPEPPPVRRRPGIAPSAAPRAKGKAAPRPTVATMAVAMAAMEERLAQLEGRRSPAPSPRGPAVPLRAGDPLFGLQAPAPPPMRENDRAAAWQEAQRLLGPRPAQLGGLAAATTAPAPSYRGQRALWAPPKAAPSVRGPPCRVCQGPCREVEDHFPCWEPPPAAGGHTEGGAQIGHLMAQLLQRAGGLLPEEEAPSSTGALPTGSTRGTAAIQAVWRGLKHRPDLVIQETLMELRHRLGLGDHEPMTVAMYARTMVLPTIPTHKTLRKMIMLHAHLFDEAYSSGIGETLEGARALALQLQAFKVSEAAARSNGVFLDWKLLPFPDPDGPPQALTLATERAALAALRREEALLATAEASASHAVTRGIGPRGTSSSTAAGGYAEGGAGKGKGGKKDKNAGKAGRGSPAPAEDGP